MSNLYIPQAFLSIQSILIIQLIVVRQLICTLFSLYRDWLIN